MHDIICACLYKTFIDKPVSTLSMTLELICSIIIGCCGVTVNYKFAKKLQIERKNTPLGRKGNVIEPIMRWFCFLQMIYWPYHLLYFWINNNEIIPSEKMKGWWCRILFSTIKIGRMTIAYNSFFVALIRYLYIVHYKASNQWRYENVGRLFQISSIAIPITMEITGLFTYANTEYLRAIPNFESCITTYHGLNNTIGMKIPRIFAVEWTMTYLPESVVLGISYIYLSITAVIALNVIEGFLYIRIHRCISRYI